MSLPVRPRFKLYHLASNVCYMPFYRAPDYIKVFSVFRGQRDYSLEYTDDRYQSMYSSKQNGENMPPSHYETLKVR